MCILIKFLSSASLCSPSELDAFESFQIDELPSGSYKPFSIARGMTIEMPRAGLIRSNGQKQHDNFRIYHRHI